MTSDIDTDLAYMMQELDRHDICIYIYIYIYTYIYTYILKNTLDTDLA